MMTATLIAERHDESTVGRRRLAVACHHGLAEFIEGPHVFPWALHLSDWDVARMVVARHFAVERCLCTAALRRQYALGES
jgi:hypothetical protein